MKKILKEAFVIEDEGRYIFSQIGKRYKATIIEHRIVIEAKLKNKV